MWKVPHRLTRVQATDARQRHIQLKQGSWLVVRREILHENFQPMLS